MLRRFLLSTLGFLLITQPVYSQTWLQRYLRERRAKEDAKRTVFEQGESPAEEVRRAEPVDAPSSPDTAPATDEPVAVAVPVGLAEAQIPVRKAELADPEPASVVATQAATPAPTPVPTPVVRVSSKPMPPAPASGGSIVVAPAAVPDSTPAPAAQASPEATTDTPGDQMESSTDVIRMAPTNRTTAPDVNQFNYANNFYIKKDYARAATEYERYLSIYPSGTDRQAAFFRMAESHRQLQNFNAARRAYEALLLGFTEGDFVGPASYRMADLCYQEKNYPDALAYYRKASVRVKDPALALAAKYYAARCNEALKSTSEAIDAYEELLKVQGTNPFREASRFALARLLADSGRRADAVAQFDMLILETDKPSLKAEATVREGLLLQEMGKGEKAAAVLNRALKMPELGSWKEVAEVSLLRAAYAGQSYKQVIDTYQASSQTFSNEARPEVLLIVANSNRQLGKDKAAKELYETIARDFPASTYAREAQYYRLISLYNMNAPELLTEVDAYLGQNSESGEKRDQLTLLKAEALYKAKKYAAAAPLYASLDDSMLSSGLKAEALFKLGWCHTQVQPRDNAAAIQAFSSFLKQYPVHKLAPTALAQRALSYQQTQNLKGALADFNLILSRYPKAAKEQELALEQKALILGQQNDNPGMAETFALLLRKFPNSAVAGKANYWIGWAACDSKNYKEATRPLQTARKLDKEHFGEKATRLLLQCLRLQEDRNGLAAEVDHADENKAKVPAEFLHWLGTEFFQAGDAAQAEKYLSRLTAQANPAELQPEDWLILGSARARQAKWAEAEKSLKTYLEKVSEPSQQATGHLALGEVYLGSKQFDEAQKSAETALSLQPEGRLNAQGRMLSGDIAMAQGEFPAAAKMYLSVSVVFGDDPEITPKALSQAYIAYKKAGDAPQASRTLNELQSRYPEYPVPQV